MRGQLRLSVHVAFGILLTSGISCFSGRASAAPDYHPINPIMADRTITLTGHDLTVDQVVQIARYGAKVQLSPEARQRQADTWGLRMEGATEGVPIYLFNRNPGATPASSFYPAGPAMPAGDQLAESKTPARAARQ